MTDLELANCLISEIKGEIENIYYARDLEELEKLTAKYRIHVIVMEVAYEDDFKLLSSLGKLGKIRFILYIEKELFMRRQMYFSNKVDEIEIILKEISVPCVVKLCKNKIKKVFSEVNIVGEKNVIINNKKGLFFLSYLDIYFIEKVGADILFHTKDDVVKKKGTLTELADILPPEFYLSNPSHIVNIEKVIAIEPDYGNTLKIRFRDTTKVASLSLKRKNKMIQLIGKV